MKKTTTLNDRAQHLLKVLVERYIREGQPVGSKTLAEDLGSNLSPATIRNIMAELEDKGFVRSPHTSSGRVPTPFGLRFFVDSLLTIQPLDKASVQQMHQQLNSDLAWPSLMNSASSLLSTITKQAGLVTLPRREKIIFRHVEFLPLAENRVLVILVVNSHEVQNRIIHTDHQYQESELQQAANFLNTHYSGKDLEKVRKQLLISMRQDRQQMHKLMQTTIDMASRTFTEQENTPDYVIAGQANLLDIADEAGMERLRQLFDAFGEKRSILKLLDQCLQAEGVQIYIGNESGYEILDDCSIVTAPYTVDEEVVGVLGVIGPKRMAYDRVIPAVDLTAKILSAALNQVK